jgi:hypothetical protein
MEKAPRDLGAFAESFYIRFDEITVYMFSSTLEASMTNPSMSSFFTVS